MLERHKRARESIIQFPDRPFTEEELDYIYLYTTELLTIQEQLEETRSKQMSVQHVVLFSEKNHVPPREVIEALTKIFGSACGLAVAMGDTIEMIKQEGEPVLDSIMQNLEAFKDCSRLLWFVKSSSKILDEDLQPLIVLENAEGKVEMVVVLEGDYSEFAKAGSSHTDAYHALMERIRPQMLKKYRGCENNVQELLKDMENDQDTQTALHHLCPDKGSVVFMGCTGELLPFVSTAVREKEFEWGAIFGPPESDKKTEPAPTPAPAPEPEKKRVLSSLGKPKATTTPTPELPKATDTKTEGAVLLGPTKQFQGMVIARTTEEPNKEMFIPNDALLIPPPPEADNKDKVQDWYKKQNWHPSGKLGHVPVNWKNRPWIVPKTIENTSTSTPALNTAGKDTSAKNIPAPRTVPQTVVKHFLEHSLPKILGPNSEYIANPMKLLEDEKSAPSLAAMLSTKEKTYVGIEDFINIGHAGRCVLLAECGVHDPSKQALLSAYLGDCFIRILNDKKVKKDQQNTIENLKKELVAANTAKQVEQHTLAQQELKPEPRKLTSLGKVRGRAA